MRFLNDKTLTIAEMVGSAEDRFLRSIIANPYHVLCALMPPTITSKHDLRPRPHNFVLLDKDDRNFIAKALYKSLPTNK